jgi:hypothetical protein
MREKKLGPWHPKGINPVRKGVYEVDYADGDGRSFSRWDGSGWSFICWERYGKGTVQDAIERASKVHIPWTPAHRWRGLLR